MLLENPLKANDLQDDLESFVHVIMYRDLHCVQHNKVAELLDLIRQIYDLVLPNWSGNAQGGHGKRLLMATAGLTVPGEDFSFTISIPLNSWSSEEGRAVSGEDAVARSLQRVEQGFE
ncbi:hypothetical protein DFS33DRAFT_1383396 [Desarmillaria ectypa]|nr:hypothetical protein DFS33DRAFT_1383396 [Desarmillaria ectypa]